MRVATPTIETLTGKSREIADMMRRRRRINILCLHETRCTGGKSGDKARAIEDGYKLYYSGGRSRNGVAICLSEEWQDKVIATEEKSDRIMAMKLVTPGKTTTW